MSSLSNKELLNVSIKNLTDLLENDDVTAYPKTLRVIASILDQRADHIEVNLQTGEQVYKF
jgi:hypothetical protein